MNRSALREILPLRRRGVSHAIPAHITLLSVVTLSSTRNLYDLNAAAVALNRLYPRLR
jgi:hypothetical protein